MDRLNKQITTEARKRTRRRDFKDGCERLAFYVYGLNLTDRLLFMQWFEDRSEHLAESRRRCAELRALLMRALNGDVDFNAIANATDAFRETLVGLSPVSGPVALLNSLDRAVAEERTNYGVE